MENRKTSKQLREELAWAHARIAELEAACAAAAPSRSDARSSVGSLPGDSTLQQERDRMAAILRGINDLCVAVDRQWRFTYVNPQAARFYGVPAEQLLGRVAWEAFPALANTHFYRVSHLAMEQGETTLFEVPSVLQPGRWLEFRTGPTPEGIVYFGTDITARKQAEQQLQALNETLEQRVAERTAEAEHRAAQMRRLAAELTRTEQRERQRLAQILHDHLQQLLVAAKLHLSSLRSRTRSESLREGLGRVHDMLLAALEASRSLTVELSPPVLRKGSMRDVLHWLAGWIRNRHGLMVNVETDTAAEPQSLEIRVLLFQAVRELLFNVVKHAAVNQAGVQLRCEGEWLKVVVSDEGVGFEPSLSATDDSKGTGFGLLSIRERLELMGGRLEIESTLGHGTRMTLVAPIQLSEGDADGLSTVMAAPAKRSAATGEIGASRPALGRRIRVLLADDHQLVQDGLRLLLASCEDIEIVGLACNGRQAIDLAVQLRPDVVLMDVDMPEVDGVEATRWIRERLPDVGVIGLSMLSEPSVAQSMIAAGAVRYLTKTSSPEVLLEAVRTAGRTVTGG
jgi:PAS domain S-box-containing protein